MELTPVAIIILMCVWGFALVAYVVVSFFASLRRRSSVRQRQPESMCWSAVHVEPEDICMDSLGCEQPTLKDESDVVLEGKILPHRDVPRLPDELCEKYRWDAHALDRFTDNQR